MKNNQIGIIGIGYWGTNIINVLQRFKIKKIYCYDVNHQNLIEIKKKFPFVKIVKELNESSYTTIQLLNLRGLKLKFSKSDIILLKCELIKFDLAIFFMELKKFLFTLFFNKAIIFSENINPVIK